MFVLLVLAWIQPAAARSDVPAQIYKLAATSTLPPLAVRPSPLPESVAKRLRGIDFLELSLPLQHALLWDAGLVASADTTRSAYVQIKVPCYSSMADVFLARDTVSDRAKGDCGFVVCNAQTLHFAFANCSLANMEAQAKCGVLDSAPVATLSANPIWMEDGEIDSEPSFRVFKKVQTASAARARNASASSSSTAGAEPTVGSPTDAAPTTTTTTMYTIVEKKDLNLVDDRASCPNKASFIIPCRQLTASDLDSAWCDPVPTSFVDLWISKELAQKKSKSEADSDATTITTFVSLFIVAAVLCAVLGCCLWHRRRFGRGSQSSSGGVHSGLPPSSELMDQHHVLLTHHHALLTGDSENTVGTSYLKDNVSAFTPAELEKVNAHFCERSRDLAEFCEDQELIMKRISYDSLHFSTLIARGANGEVWRGEYGTQDVAVKRLLREKQGEVMHMEIFAREIRLASTLEHPNIVKFIGLSWRSLSELCMVSEFMPSGDLAHFLLSKESRNMSWQNLKMTLALDIANALVYLHSLMPVIIHRDLKSLNVLLSENLEAKLSDFGLSRERSFDETMTSGVGTLLWTAPEVLRGDRYTEKADIYSFGVVLSELDTCLPPYSLNEEVARAKQKSAQLLPRIRGGQIKPAFRASVPKPLLALALACLEFIPEKRPNAMQIVYTLRSKIMPALA